MEATFYGVLGVPPDADDQTIVHAFRERVKECHPDVSDRPDARMTFTRLKTARDVLTDPAERDRYDRLGHAAYLRRTDDCVGWDVPTARTVSSAAEDDMRTGNDETAPVADGGRTSRSTVQSGADSSPAAQARRYASGRSERARSTEQSRQGSSATVDGTATAYYSPGRRVNPGSGSPLEALVDVLQRLGIWALLYVLLVVSAVGTAWLILTWGAFGPVSVTLASFVLVAALTVSTLQLSVRLYP